MDNDQSIVFLVLTGALIMLLIALLVIYFVFAHRKKFLIQQNELLRIKNEKDLSILRAIVKTQEEERSRIALDLHDGVGMNLLMVQHNLIKHLDLLQHLPPAVKDMEQDILKLKETIKTIRGVCQNLYPGTIKNMGLLSALKQIAEQVQDSGKMTCTIHCPLNESDLPENLELKVNCFRICQELINNLLKHANCSHLLMTLSRSDQVFHLHFKHNGLSFTNIDALNMSANGAGMGLNSIRRRIDLMQGKINYMRTSAFSLIELEIPLSPERQN